MTAEPTQDWLAGTEFAVQPAEHGDPVTRHGDPPAEAAALDFGTTEARSLRIQDARLIASRQTAAYTVLPGHERQLRFLRSNGIAWTSCEDAIVVVGSSAPEVAATFDVPLVDVLPNGELPESDPVGRQIVSLLVESILPPGGGVCAIALPGDPVEDTTTTAFIGNVVALRGYRPLLARGASAAGLSVLTDFGLTGIMVDAGATGVSVAAVHRGREINAITLPGGAASVTRRLAESDRRVFFDREGNQYFDLLACERWLQSPMRNLLSPATREEARLTLDITKMAAAIADAVSRLADRYPTADARPAVALIGGLCRLHGFASLIADEMAKRGVVANPMIVDESEDGLTVARGLLAVAEVERPRAASAA